MGNCHPVTPRGDNFPCYPIVQSIFIILYWMLILSMHLLYYVWFQNNPGQVNIWVYISSSVNSNAHMTPDRIYGEPYVHQFCGVDIFLNITRRQVISPVAQFHHLLGCGFVNQWVILIFTKCLSILHESIIFENILIAKHLSPPTH